MLKEDKGLREEINVHLKQYSTGSPFGVIITWSQPSDAHHYILEVSGERDGSCCFPLIPPEYVDRGWEKDRPYEIGIDIFEGKGFKPGSNYHYSIQALSANDVVICTCRGSFFR